MHRIVLGNHTSFPCAAASHPGYTELNVSFQASPT